MDIEYLAEQIAISIWNGETESRTDSKEREYYYVDLTAYPTEKLPVDKEELKETLEELGAGIMEVFSFMDDGNRMMGGDGIFTPNRIRVKKGAGESLMIYLR